jgi:sulfur-oxidizing protein SoxX
LRSIAAPVLAAVLGGCAAVGLQAAEDAMDIPLTAAAGDPVRGREVLMGRDGNCLLCHAVPQTGARFMGDLGPPLSGVGSRLSAGQLRLRLVDMKRLNPQTIMPSYFRTEGLVQVAEPYRGKPVLTAQQIEDVVAYLRSLR